MRLLLNILVVIALATFLAGAVPIALTSHTVLAQATPEVQWSKTFGNAGSSEWGSSVQQTSDGGYIVVGSVSAEPDVHDILLIKTDSSGNKQWEKRDFRQPSWEYAIGYYVEQTTDGGYIIAGTMYYGHYYALLIKTDSAGDTQWYSTFGSSEAEAFSVQQTSDGGYILTGYVWHTFGGSNPEDVWLIKTDSSGNIQWDKIFSGGSGSDRGCSVQETSDGGYIVAGSKTSSNSMRDIWLIKTDSSGNMQWDKTFGGTQDDYVLGFSCVKQTSDGGYVVVGRTNSFSTSQDLWLIKTDSNGSKEFDKVFDNSGRYDGGLSVQQTSDEGYIVSGHTSGGASLDDVWLVKTNSNGSMEWDMALGGSSGEYGYSVQQTSDGGYILAGYTHSYGAGDCNVWLIKLGPEPPPESAETPVGSNVTVTLPSAAITFNTVTGSGNTTVTTSQGNPGGGIPSGCRVRGLFIDITTTATYTGNITVGISYDPSTPNPQNLKLFHSEGGHWVDVTTSVDTVNHIVYGVASSFSWFFIGGEWVWVSSVPVFPSVYIGIAAALGAGVLAYFVRRRLVKQE